MKDLEQILDNAKLAEPSSRMDTAVETLFREHTSSRPRLINKPIALWKCAAACAFCTFIGVVLSLSLREPVLRIQQVTERIYYVPQSIGEYRNPFKQPNSDLIPAKGRSL